ncbi:hypothetical protein C7296_11980 [Burkholderia thailandensis]|nr:hypothetical protein [Burkholderia thailandensis]
MSSRAVDEKALLGARGIVDHRPRTANREPRTANREPRTANREPRTANRVLRTAKGTRRSNASRPMPTMLPTCQTPNAKRQTALATERRRSGRASPPPRRWSRGVNSRG